MKEITVKPAATVAKGPRTKTHAKSAVITSFLKVPILPLLPPPSICNHTANLALQIAPSGQSYSHSWVETALGYGVKF